MGGFFFDLDNGEDMDIFKTDNNLSRPFGQEERVFESPEGGRYRAAFRKVNPCFRKVQVGQGTPWAGCGDGDADVTINKVRVAGGPDA